MSALNLYSYADIFKSKDIKGSDLRHLDRDKLMVSKLYYSDPMIIDYTYTNKQTHTSIDIMIFRVGHL